MNANDSVMLVAADTVEVTSHFFHRDGSDDYTNDRISIIEIENADAKPLQPVWTTHWTEIAPGIRTRCAGGTQRVRVSPAACPVGIRLQSTSEYVSYSDAEYCRQSSTEYWISCESLCDQDRATETARATSATSITERLSRFIGSLLRRSGVER